MEGEEGKRNICECDSVYGEQWDRFHNAQRTLLPLFVEIVIKAADDDDDCMCGADGNGFIYIIWRYIIGEED